MQAPSADGVASRCGRPCLQSGWLAIVLLAAGLGALTTYILRPMDEQSLGVEYATLAGTYECTGGLFGGRQELRLRDGYAQLGEPTPSSNRPAEIRGGHLYVEDGPSRGTAAFLIQRGGELLIPEAIAYGTRCVRTGIDATSGAPAPPSAPERP